MSISLNIQQFLHSKLKTLKLTRQDLIKGSGLTPSGVCGLMNAEYINPTLSSIIKIANFFNCSVDEVLGRDKYIKSSDTARFRPLTQQDIIKNIKTVLCTELKMRNITAAQLSKSCGIGKDTVSKYLNNTNVHYTFSIKTILAISEFLSLSIDDLIGRDNS
ncbi:helix-turn-helix transcriptional regulator [Rickettsia hoogstraalii]|uniref:helix-turn-helix domain-containing protein n=1 Tax=Rickettsia hoogstraalii TaxID=467174 RepID=UPI00225118B0|nr:helix-turn-helix transcriptional regulator [Rickettsia hoogstraalii]MCX4084723.1 helix-turn-helix transcriptional regulator [Rickettsia hoogstraalii]